MVLLSLDIVIRAFAPLEARPCVCRIAQESALENGIVIRAFALLEALACV
jgi:hypothetical protein